MSEYGEPWTYDEDGQTFVRADGYCAFDFVSRGEKASDRVLACVNAMAGIADPAAVRAVVEAARKWRNEMATGDTIQGLLDALAALDAGAKEAQP